MEIISDLQLIDNVKKHNDDNSFIELSNRHTPLCHNIYNKFSTALQSSGICIQDVKEDKDLVMYKAILSYKPEKNVKFSTWLGNNIRFQCLNTITASGKYVVMETDAVAKLVDSNADNSVEEAKNDKDYLFSILEQTKDTRIVNIFKARYFDSYPKKPSWKSIAAKMDISAQTAINLHKRGMKILSQKLLNDNLFDKI